MPKTYDMTNVPAKSGRILGEDGKVYNLVDLLQEMGGGNMDPNDFYTKEEIDNLLSKKANSSSLSNKADKAVVDDLIARVEALESAGGA